MLLLLLITSVVSDSVRPHRRQPTRLRHPWILQARTLEWVTFPSPLYENEKWKWSRSVVSNSERPHGLQPTRLLRPWDFPGKSIGVGCQCHHTANSSAAFWNFLDFFFPNISYPMLVEESKDLEGQLYVYHVLLWNVPIIFSIISNKGLN